ncbi:MAG: His/Gly/Thr/Pro-type tRNA ligase C-terminal domain-containing protein, partial [Symbiobacteriaceae bacterium]|nr:His/Gly/Thr/Pro-type tRNA ligase C-terminal domain-containing protein [Symbiobacteriaceae bacterium]
ALGEDAQRQAVKMLHGLRGSGISGEMDLQHRGLKAQMRQADRLKADYVAILGEEELAKGIVTLRNMTSKEQIELSWNDLQPWLKSQLT